MPAPLLARAEWKKVAILLDELGIPYDIIPCNIGRGDRFEPDFLVMNPNHRMPVLVETTPPTGIKSGSTGYERGGPCHSASGWACRSNS